MDEARLNDFMGKLVNDMGGAAMLANVILGEELGLYRAMADSQPVTPEALADKTGCNTRLLREWLSAHAASGYMEHRDGQFRLCLLYTSPSPRDATLSRMPSSA